MKKKINIGAIIGNRDIYFKKSEKVIDLLRKYNIDIIENNDDKNSLVLNKNNFLKTSKCLYADIDIFKKIIKVHFIDLFLDKYDEKYIINKIFLYATNQNHITDTIYIAKIIQKLYNNVIIEEINIDPRDFLAMKHFFDEKICFDDSIYIQASSGVPTTRHALYFSVLFKKNVKVFEINNEKLNFENLKNLEKEILKDKIINAINNYNYEGLQELFQMGYPKKYSLFANILKNRINFNLQDSEYKSLLNSFEDLSELYFYKNIFDVKEKPELNFLELINNILIKLKKEQYLDFISRLYSFEDNLYQYFISLIYYSKVGERISLKKKESFFECKNKDNNVINFIQSIFADLFTGNELKSYKNIKIKNSRVFYYYFLQSIIKSDLVNYEIKEKIKYALDFITSNFISSKDIDDFNSKNIMALRNKTIVAHGLKGVNKESFKLFFELDEFEIKIIKFYEKIFDVRFRNIFDEVNNYLISKLNEK